MHRYRRTDVGWGAQEGAEIKGATSPRRTLEMLQTLRGVRTRVDDYESFHVLFWIGKDLAWALDFKWMWLFFGVGTLVLAADLVFLMRVREPTCVAAMCQRSRIVT